MVADIFKICSVKINGKYICDSKNRIFSILIMPTGITLPQVFIIIPQKDRNCPFLPNSMGKRIMGKRIIERRGKRGEDYGVEKSTGYWSEF